MKLFRYSRLSEYIVKYFNDMELYFQNPLHFNDPFECDLSNIHIGAEDNFDYKFQNYNELLIKRLDYLYKKINQISARITDCDDPVDERYYYDKEASLYFEEAKKLEEELKILKSCRSSEREQALIKSWEKKKRHVVNGLGVVCFSEDNSNILMWSHYAESHKGICLEYDSEERPIKHWKNYKYHKIKYSKSRYIDLLESGYEKAFFKLVTTKSTDWEYEKEYRLISIRGSGYQKSQMGSLTGIIFGPRIKENKKELLEDLYNAIKNHNSRRKSLKLLKFYHAEKDLRSFKINIKEIPYYVDLKLVFEIN